MTDHRATLDAFLRTDRLRLETTLPERRLDAAARERLAFHVRAIALHRLAYLEARRPTDPELVAAGRLPEESDEPLIERLVEEIEALRATIRRTEASRLDAPVLDPHERGLTVLGHLYELCRASAMLVEWARHLPPRAYPGSLATLVGEE